MEASEQLAQPFDGFTVEGACHIPSENLRHLLEDERFLLLIFEHLVEYGLQECRLVCRRWRSVCKQFPVKIKDIATEDFARATDAFPNAVSVSMNSFKGMGADSKLSGQFLQLTRLKSLSFVDKKTRSVRSRSRNMRTSLNPLEVDGATQSADWMDDMISSLRHLTNLTRLVLFTKPGRPKAVKPIVELEKIRELEVSTRLFSDDQGKCVFPSLTNLTHLGLTDDEVSEEAPLLSFEAVERYASSIESLSLYMSSNVRRANFSSLLSLTKLKALELDTWSTCRHDVWEAITQIQSITRLRTLYAGNVKPSLENFIARLKGLKVLDAQDLHTYYLRADDDTAFFGKVAQVTELAFALDGRIPGKFSCLVCLEHLSLKACRSFAGSLDEALMHLPLLKSLAVELKEMLPVTRLECPDVRSFISNFTLSKMHRLRSLTLRRVSVGSSFFSALATKTELRKLEFRVSERWGCPLNFISHVNLLKNLEELTLCLRRSNESCQELSPENLSRLKRLTVDCSEELTSALHRAFNQSIYPVTVNRTKTAWLSRLTT